MLAGAGKHEILLDERALPVTIDGLARYNVANALAAAAALLAAGFEHRAISEGLKTFISDGSRNPLCSTVFDIEGVTVVADFAHNRAAYEALSEMARGMANGQIVGVVSAPGDRRDSDLRDIGPVCAAGFDRVIVYESESCARPAGEAARLIADGVRQARHEPGSLDCIDDVHERFAMACACAALGTCWYLAAGPR